MNGLFERAMPENEGISSDSVINFIKLAEKRGLPLHSFLLFRRGRLLFEGYYSPYDKSTLHRVFSVTKSFTSAAVGILYGLGKIDLSAPIISYFPEYDSICRDDVTRAATVKDLLSMRSPHIKTAFKQVRDDNYARAFFSLSATKFPNGVFCYDSSATHTLAVLVERLAGMSLCDFLREHIPGLSPNMYSVKDPKGYSRGDSGFMATSMDIALLAHLFLKGGRLNGRQIIPEDYAKAAVSKVTDTSVMANCRSEGYGYGYSLWKTDRGGFMAYGIGGQLGAAYPEKDIVFVTTGDTFGYAGGIDTIFDLFYDCIYDKAAEGAVKRNDKAYERLLSIGKELCLPVIKGGGVPKGLFNKIYGAGENFCNMDDVCIVCKNGGMLLKFVCNKGRFELPFMFGRLCSSVFPYYNYKCFTYAYSPNDTSVIIKCHIADEEIGTVSFYIDIKNDVGTLIIRKTVPTYFDEFNIKCMLREKRT